MTGTITKIESQKRNKDRYNIYIDGEYGFSLHGEVIVKNRLAQDMIVDILCLKKWIREDDVKRALDISLHFLRFRERSKNEIENHLKNKGYDMDIVEETLGKLDSFGYLNDNKFALSWIKNGINNKYRSKRMIKQELRSKGVEDEVIDNALDQIDDSEVEEAALRMAKKYFSKYRELDRKETVNKVGQALVRRGFDWDIIRRTIKQCMIDD